MGQIYTKKKEDHDNDERTMNVSEFVDRMVSNQRIPEKKRQENYTEAAK